tara:strand:- start:245 stop:583 length:339 start_codon:yes stop_codon:yes gene_type:complete
MKYNFKIGDKKGFLTRVDMTLAVTKIFRDIEKEFMKTKYAIILLALDSEFRTLSQLRRMAHPDVMDITSDSITTFLIELESMGLIESKRDGSKHRVYRRLTRKDINNKRWSE